MIDILKHMFGLCGEGHPNILYISGAVVILYRYYINMIKFKINNIFSKIHGKNKL